MASTTSADGEGGATATTEVEAPTAEERAAQRRKARRARKWLVNVLAVITCLSTLLTVVAVWTHRTLFDTDQWMEIIGPLADDPAVTDAVAVAVTDQVFQVIDAQQLAEQALPDQAQFLAAPLTNAVQGYVGDGVAALLQTEQFQTVWDRANRRAHDAVVALLRGEPVAGLTAQDGTVTLNLLPLLSKVMIFLQEKIPSLFGGRPVPEITQETPIDQARQELSTAVGRPVPDGFGTYVVFQSDQLGAAQQAVKLFDRLVYVLAALTIALFVATMVLSRNRRRTLLVLGLGIALAMIVANSIVSAVQDQVVGLIGGEAARQAAAVTIGNLVDSLEVSTTALTWIGLAVVVVAFLLGDGRAARGVRHVVAGGARRARSQGSAMVARHGSGGAPVPVVAEHLGLFRAAGVVLTMLWLVVATITWVKLALILLVFVAYQVAITVLGRTEDGGAPPPAEPSDLAAGPA